MQIETLAPFKLIGLNFDQLEEIALAAREIIFGNADMAAKKHAGLILHYVREYQR